jgi:hypothetical protein
MPTLARAAALAAILVPTAACGSTTDAASGAGATAAATTTTATSSTTGAGGSGGGAPAAGPTLHGDVAPILDAKCGACHVDGGIAPFSTSDVAAVTKWAAAIGKAVADRTMPPWPPAKGCTEYAGDRSLTDAQIATITAWVAAGAPEGDPAHPGPKLDPGPSRALSRVDLTLGMAAEYTPQEDPDDYRCFVVDWPKDAVSYVSGFRANPGNPAVVHHIIAFLIPPKDVPAVEALDAAEDGAGYTCFGGSGTNATWIGAWAPGSLGTDYTEGTGIEIEPGSKIVLQVHYNTLTAGRQPDRSSIDVKLEDHVAKKAWVQPWANPQWLSDKPTMRIPAATKDVVHSFTIDPTPYISDGKAITIHSAGLHMHTLGKSASLRVVRKGGGEECLLDIPSWNFHWQGTYELATPKLLSPGDKLSLECHWDNPTPKDVTWGEGTEDEMCLGTFYATTD